MRRAQPSHDEKAESQNCRLVCLGNEPVGFVTIYGWDDKGNLVGLGQIEKTKLQPNVPMNCPYP